MKRPDWKDAPKWANFVAMDSSGAWWWYEEKPAEMLTGDGSGAFTAGGHNCQPVQFDNWRDSMESRPSLPARRQRRPETDVYSQAPTGYRMTDKAGGAPYGAFVEIGWTDAQLIAHGHMERVP